MAWCFSTRASVARVLCHTHAFTVIYGLRYHGLPEWEKLLLCMYSEYIVMLTCKFVEVLQYIHFIMKTLLNKLLCCQWFELMPMRHTVMWCKYLTFDTFHKQHQVLYAVWYFTYLLPCVCNTLKYHDLVTPMINECVHLCWHFYTPNEVRGYIGFTLSVCLSVRLSVC